jgi:hypothetical protein
MRQLALLLIAAGCTPAFAEDSWLVTSARVLAVKSEPAEIVPGNYVNLTALVADAKAHSVTTGLEWRLCNAPKPATESNAVSTACLDELSLQPPLAMGDSARLAPASDACARFGPATPSGDFRARAPDNTGGYYQPLRLDLATAEPVFHLIRLRCGLAEAPAEIATEYARRYSVNLNPGIESLLVKQNGRVAQLDAIPARATLSLELRLSQGSQEEYAYFNSKQQALTIANESLRVNWYVSAGELSSEVTEASESNAELHSSNTWTAPAESGSVSLWVVLRDSRGGSDYQTYTLGVGL